MDSKQFEHYRKQHECIQEIIAVYEQHGDATPMQAILGLMEKVCFFGIGSCLWQSSVCKQSKVCHFAMGGAPHSDCNRCKSMARPLKSCWMACPVTASCSTRWAVTAVSVNGCSTACAHIGTGGASSSSHQGLLRVALFGLVHTAILVLPEPGPCQNKTIITVLLSHTVHVFVSTSVV